MNSTARNAAYLDGGVIRTRNKLEVTGRTRDALNRLSMGLGTFQTLQVGLPVAKQASIVARQHIVFVVGIDKRPDARVMSLLFCSVVAEFVARGQHNKNGQNTFVCSYMNKQIKQVGVRLASETKNGRQ